ncbi:MAG: ATP-binding cassette domain-containing protein [Bacteroidales bacterium]|nr:ATP-binding cassette domain-containing protein [Bacteroidales bacterium]
MMLNVEKLSKSYGPQKALDEVSFSVTSPQVVGLLGPNGAGKSTLMKLICGYLVPDAGRVEVCGSDTVKQALQARAKIGYLPEHNPLYLDMYVREYLEFVGRIYTDFTTVSKRMREVIEAVGLQPEAHKKIGALSKGYRQRLGLAQALIHNPEILILDESTSGLDPNQLEEIRELVRRIGQEKTVLFSTHIMQEAQAVCSRVLLLNQGHLIADAPTVELTRHLQGKVRICVEFDREVDGDDFRAFAAARGAEVERENEKNTYGIVCNADGTDIRAALFFYAVEKGLSVLTLQREEDDLETVFHKLTHENPAKSK